MITCDLCGSDDFETCGCWEVVDVIELSDAEFAQIQRDLDGETIQ
jgi:hypothetical protein